jgi:hypothetical protein
MERGKEKWKGVACLLVLNRRTGIKDQSIPRVSISLAIFFEFSKHSTQFVPAEKQS